MRWETFFFIIASSLYLSCTSIDESKTAMRFSQVSTSHSNIDFANRIIENDSLNYFSFPFLYLGGGVSVGDINNDGLPDIYFTGNLVPNKLYLNKGNLEFEDITESAAVAGDKRWYSGTTMADVNNDGFLDIYLSVSGKFGDTANQLFINQGNNTFLEEAKAFGIADESTSIQSTFFDYNNDGYLDLFVANYPVVQVSMGNQYYKDKIDENSFEDSGHLFKNNGDGTFSDVTRSAGVQRFGLSLGLVATDFNDDGYKDLYLSNDFNVPDYLYQNNGNGTFSEISQKVARHTSMFGMGIDAADFNNDQRLDLLQVDMTAEDYKRSKTNMASMSPDSFYDAVDLGFNYQYMQNSLQVNNGISDDGYPIFSDISRFAGMSTTDWSWGAVFADLDNDGWKDVFISNGVKRDVNNNDVNAKYNSATFFGRAENPDFRLMPSTPIANYAYKNNGDFTFSNVTQNWALDQKGFSNGFAYSDLDNDGDLDVIINNMDELATIYVNEAEKTENRYLKVKLNGTDNNPFALGTKVILAANGSTQMQELTLTRGYQSSVEPILHFGLGKDATIDSLEVIWPNGNRQRLTNIDNNQLVEITFNTSELQNPEPRTVSRTTFENLENGSEIDFIHTEDDYDDFTFEPLLPHKNSALGPALAVGDINQDGLDDFFIGNAKGKSGELYIQNKLGNFDKIQGPWQEDGMFEDTGALFFDADNDHDLDLFVVNGGNEGSQGKEFYQDRLYINTENGFVKGEQILPLIESSGSAVISGDYDNDGDLDLFLGGRINPGKYPFPAPSYILRNDGGKDQDLRFTDVTLAIAPELAKAGLVTSALWDDFDNDGNLDLIIAGEWMPIRFFSNKKGIFEEKTEELNLSDNVGWWYSLNKADIDNDGDTDYIAGNLGLNYKYHASKDNPFEIYANDFDENGKMDIVLSHKDGGVRVPLRGRECSSQQVPAIKRRFKTFEAFAQADLTAIYGEKMLKESLNYSATTFAHYWLENLGNGTFEKHKLPNQAQFSSINSIQVFDYNNDAYPDLLLAGNLYNAEVETPRADAGVGLVLTGTETAEFDVVPSSESGIMINGEVRSIQDFRTINGVLGFLFAINDQPLKMMVMAKTENNDVVP